jgi:hypothetical protein
MTVYLIEGSHVMQFGWNPFRKRCKLRIEPTEYYDNPLTRFLEKGDIILYRGEFRQFLAALIMEFTRSPYSHVDIYVGDGWSISAEAYGMTLHDHCNTDFIDIMRLKGGLPRETRAIVLEKAYQSLAKPYEYLGFLGFPFGSEKAAARRSANEAYICSENVAWCYKKADIDLIEGKPESIEAPADIAQCDKLEWLGSWKNGRPVSDVEIHKFHRDQLSKQAGFARWLVKNVADRLSDRDEYYEKLRDNHFQGSRDQHYRSAEKEYISTLKGSQRIFLDAAEIKPANSGQ